MAWSRRWTAAGLAVAGWMVAATPGQSSLAAEARPRVVLSLEGCEPALAAEVRRIVGVELHAAVADVAGAGDLVTGVQASCRGSTVDLALADAGSGTRLEHTVALGEATPGARPRLIALAVAELVVASWQEIEKAPAPARPSPPPPEPSPNRADQPPGLPRRWTMVEALGVARTFPGSRLWLLGAGARVGFTLVGPVRLTLELGAEWGAAARASGQVAARALGGALGLGFGLERRWMVVMPWVGARAGEVTLTGEPSPTGASLGATQSGPWLGPEAGIVAIWFPQAAVHPTLALSAGTMLLGVRGLVTGDSNVNAQGPWVALVIGVGLNKP